MTRDEIRNAVIQALTNIAPEIDPQTLQADTVLRQEFDLDSMDFLNFVIGRHDTLGVDVPEHDYPHLATFNGAVDYLASRVPACSRRSALITRTLAEGYGRRPFFLPRRSRALS